ncbi:MAG: triose-phosphate isomerase [Erysipelotrichaceae bacterium]|jgi:triosephosphate isomerase|nr:triose-phosphate isomerase [Erysipelotrichaceae bacterium]
MRRKLLLGNWKMNKLDVEAKEFAIASTPLAEIANKHNIDLGVAPTYLSLKTVRENSAFNMIVASQNVHFEDHGAFTGEISIPMLKEIGINWSIIGHSERRTYDGETSEKCNKKVLALLANDMVPVYCCGESLEIFENNLTKQFVKDQIVAGLKDIPLEKVSKLVVAYEPIWSIGTGKSASKEIAEDICRFIREVLCEMYGEVSDDVRILYGGSVKPENIKEYLSCPNVDGALVGGASLKIDSYSALLENIL